MTHRDPAGPVCSLTFVALLVILSTELPSLGAGIQLRDNGYDGVLVAINPQVAENQSLISNIQEMITEASFYLFNATKRRVFFRNIQILIPATWKAKNYSKAVHESYEKANVLVTDWSGAYGDDPFALQYRGCGQEGKYIHFTPAFLLNEKFTAGYGARGRVFVHEWAHLRWGVFDEYNNDKPFYINGQNQIKVTRCSSDITGIFVCEKGPCPQENCIISKLFKEGCVFIYNSTQNATASIMFMQSLSSVVEFCNASTHNQEAPNRQNQICSLTSAWDIITASEDFNRSAPLGGTELPPPPTFSLVQAGDKVVCLVLDVSSKMAEDLFKDMEAGYTGVADFQHIHLGGEVIIVNVFQTSDLSEFICNITCPNLNTNIALCLADRLLRLQQAAEFFLLQIVEIHTFVGIASFSSKGEIRAPLQQINSRDDRKQLVSHLPTTVSTEAEISVCSGLKKGFQVVEKLNGKAYGAVIILVTSGADEHVGSCLHSVLTSGSTIHSIALGSSAARNLEELSRRTGGLKFFVPDQSNSNSMMDAFSRISSGTGDIFQQSIQLGSTSETVKPHRQLKNTVLVDDSVGNGTVFLVAWQTSGPPEIVLLDPNGREYHTNNFITNPAFQTASLWIPGTAKPGLWTYILNNTHHSPQALKMTVASRASSSAVPPVTVEAFVDRDTTSFPHPVMIYANVRKGSYPIRNATVTATVEPETGEPVMLKLLDDGAGADVIKDDGIYSRYFFSFAVSGRYSLKVHVSHSPSIHVLTHSVPGSHAMYAPGYIANGNIQMNAPRNSVGRREEWGFSRTSSGGSFSVLGVPAGPHPDVFPPCRITDLEAARAEEEVTLSWTAPGEDFDQGQATSYEIRMSNSLQNIQDDFHNAILVNSSKLNPQQAGTREIFIFSPTFFINTPEYQLVRETQDSHRIYVAIQAMDRNSLKSVVSNIAQVSLFIPPNSVPVLARDRLILKGVLIVIGSIGMICLIIVATHCTLNRKKRADKKENGTKLL